MGKHCVCDRPDESEGWSARDRWWVILGGLLHLAASAVSWLAGN